MRRAASVGPQHRLVMARPAGKSHLGTEGSTVYPDANIRLDPRLVRDDPEADVR
jgi:hypothetical protein